MRLEYVRPHNSITAPVSDEDLSDFVVLSGPNGSGKSHLLEAIEAGALIVDGSQASPQYVVRRFVANQLAAPHEGAQQSAAYRDAWVNLETQVDAARQQLEAQNPDLKAAPDQLEANVHARLVEQRQLTLAAISQLTTRAEKPLMEFTHSDFRRYAPLLSGVKDPFTMSISELFLTYHNRLVRNQFQQWLQDSGKSDVPALDDEVFMHQFGKPPWEMLDETMALIGLDYKFVPPEGVEENQQYEVKLRHETNDADVTTDLLSSGEKTLLAIAMSLYTGSSLEAAIELPKVLLLDEADSTLHPSMVKSLLQVIREVFVATYGVKVILTTHSPTTVALAPEETLYTMRRAPHPRLRRARDRDEALNGLTVGLSTLSVRVDHRRTVFVESEYDESCYQELFRLLRPRLNSEFSLEFIASGRGGQGNSAAVKYLVKMLRESGNTTVWGIVDKDSRQGAGEGIVFIGDRYSIENLVLDPLILGAFLLREGKVTSDVLGLDPELRHFDLRPEHAQRVVDAVSATIGRIGDDDDPMAAKYCGGFEVVVPAFWQTMQGHGLEDRVREAYPPLRAFDKKLKLSIISKAFGDLPDFVPLPGVDVLKAILDGASGAAAWSR